MQNMTFSSIEKKQTFLRNRRIVSFISRSLPSKYLTETYPKLLADDSSLTLDKEFFEAILDDFPSFLAQVKEMHDISTNLCVSLYGRRTYYDSVTESILECSDDYTTVYNCTGVFDNFSISTKYTIMNNFCILRESSEADLTIVYF